MNGAWEMPWFFSCCGFEDFLSHGPDMLPIMEKRLEPVSKPLVSKRGPGRHNTTYNETIRASIDVYAKSNSRISRLMALHWCFESLQTISDRISTV